MENNKSLAFRRGILVFVVLAVLTGFEFLIGLIGGLIPLLILIALIKAGLVIWFYMHVIRLLRPDEGSH